VPDLTGQEDYSRFRVLEPPPEEDVLEAPVQVREEKLLVLACVDIVLFEGEGASAGHCAPPFAR
jgi:hypothetical protein